MSGELLNDLLSLQIPNVHHVVLRAADDPLASGDGEVGKDAVLLVLVARVRLERLALGVVPQFERGVESGGEDVLAVGGELDVGHGRVVVVDEGLEALAGLRVPDSAENKNDRVIQKTIGEFYAST